MVKKILIGLVVALVIIQAIRPTRNIAAETSPNDITLHYAVPGDVQQVLAIACNDCHSNNTFYPWYTNIQPIGWWLQHHVNEGKDELNFSEFNTYTDKRKAHKMEEVVEMIEQNEMPLESYTWMHHDAKLTTQQKDILVKWAKALQLKLEANL